MCAKNCSLLCCAATYNLARMNLRRAEDTSGLDTDVEVKLKRRSRPVRNDDSDNSLSYEALSTSLPQLPAPPGLNVASELLSDQGHYI